VAAELVRNHAFTGFPWVRLGNALHTIPPLLQLASLTGVYGLSFLLLALASSLALLARPALRRTGGIYLTLLLLVTLGVFAWGSVRVERLRGEADTERGVNVACVQGNVPQDRKWSREAADEILTRHLDLTRLAASRGAELVVWAESSLPFPLREHPEFGRRVRQAAQETGSALIIGSLDWRAGEQGRRQVYNSVFLVPAGEPPRLAYDKAHLVPFGEYVPLRRLLFFASKLVEEVGELSAGSGEQHLAAGTGVPGVPGLGILICYEIIFPGLARQAVNAGAQVLLTLTNDAWFGKTAAPHQHFAEAVLRAVESGRWVVRAANTGISGIIAPSGDVLARTELGQATLAQAEVFPRSERTLYVRVGDVFAWACVIVAAVVAAGTATRGPRKLAG
jgi:apolipoprotein N-acyltransferase